ncbi:FRG domain-containing protein [Chryseobacterium lactis]|uniref:FRG domain-containing protein n=1 Tax=Chryseobacterium lactis TaxID=1241981 RepID=UPI001624AF6F|nr:FRG domain-containing protein [Chryseobacterium lactis]
MKVKTVRSVTEYLYLINKLENNDFNWFRGHTHTSYQLEPTLYRNKKEVITGIGDIKIRHYEVENEEIAIKEFKDKLQSKIANYQYNDLDYLYLMQHNGIDTRLLDFTSSPLIALFFSVAVTKEKKDPNNFKNIVSKNDDDEFDPNCSAVFCINPLKINLISFNKEEVIDFKEKSLTELRNLPTPVCIEPTNIKIDKRLEIQKGKFVFFGSEVKQLDWYTEVRKNILKILIPDEERSEILKELDSEFNINYSTVYPDYEGLKKHINMKTKDNYLKL